MYIIKHFILKTISTSILLSMWIFCLLSLFFILPSWHLGLLLQMTTSCMCDKRVFFRASVSVTEDEKDIFHNTKLQDGENVTEGINKVLTLPCADRFLGSADIQILHAFRTESAACLRLFGAIMVILQL